MISLESPKRLFRGQELLQTFPGLFVVSRTKLRIRIRNLLRDGENSVEHDGMHVAKTYAKTRGTALRPISMMNEIKEHA